MYYIPCDLFLQKQFYDELLCGRQKLCAARRTLRTGGAELSKATARGASGHSRRHSKYQNLAASPPLIITDMFIY